MITKQLAGRLLACLAAVTLLIAALARPSLAADGPHQAGLIVMHGDGRVITRCVTFSETSINGIELLQRSGLDLIVDATNMVGSAVCRIDNEGCTFPAQSCFCQCQGMKCVYWSYWILGSDDAWRYANLGAGARSLHDGDVDVWLWGSVTNATIDLLPALRFDQICAPPTPTPSPTATATLPPPTEAPPPTATNRPPPTATPEPSATPTRPLAAALTASPTESLLSTSIPSATAAVPASSATSPAPGAPTPTWRPGTPIVTAPTIPPASTGAQSLAATATPPAGTGGTMGQTAAPRAAASPTGSSALVARSQGVPSETPRPVATGPRPTPLLGSLQTPTPVETPQPSASARPARWLPVLGIFLAGFGVSGVALLLLKRLK